MTANGPAIETNDLSKTYSQGLIFRQRHVALQNVSLTVQRGEIFGLLGPNGAGKTTFLKIMLGIIRKTLSLIHISEPTRPRLISYAVFCLKK